MATIIGFVPEDTIGGLPLVFDAQGHKVDYDSSHAFNTCPLIIVSDESHNKKEIRGADDDIAYFIQHNSNSGEWSNQITCFENWNWKPSRVDTYSRNQGGPFNVIIGNIRENQSQINLENLKQLQQHCQINHNIRHLDLYAQYIILGDHNNASAAREQLRGADNAGAALGNFPDNLLTSEQCLQHARRKMSELLTR